MLRRAGFTLKSSALARRVLGLFLVCSLLPCAIYGTYSERQLRRNLLEQERGRLQNEARAAGQRLLDRLLSFESHLVRWTENLSRGSLAEDVREKRALPCEFRSIWVEAESQVVESVGAPPAAPRRPAADERAWLEGGNTALAFIADRASGSAIFRWTRLLSGEGDRAQFLVVDLEANRFLEEELEILTGDPLVILHEGERVFRSGAELPDGWDSGLQAEVRELDLLSWRHGDEELRGASWTLALGHRFGCAPLRLVVAVPLAKIQEPLGTVRRTYILLGSLTVLFVLFLCVGQIRRLLEPLEAVCRGTARLAEGELGARIEIRTGDEFESLARDFNRMASQLERQFETSEITGAINNTVLSSLDPDSIIASILEHLPSLVPATKVSLVEFVTSEGEVGILHDTPGVPGRPVPDRGSVTTRMHGHLRAQPDPCIAVNPENQWIAEALGMVEPPPQSVFPMVAKGHLVGAISISGAELAASTRERVRRVADHALIALENARMVAQLDRLSWGTLRALARTVDAKSPWTAGHSERVSTLARSLAEELGLGAEDQERISRGGLLHDLGKIGTPVDILDKAGPLTPRERDIMQQHVIVGEQILQPIEEYAPLLPMVRSHHERWDGKGYPDRLKGTNIPFDARILRVADVYDALVTNRPYRAGMDPARAVEMIMEGIGSEFDAECAQALWACLSKDRKIGPRLLEGKRS